MPNYNGTTLVSKGRTRAAIQIRPFTVHFRTHKKKPTASVHGDGTPINNSIFQKYLYFLCREIHKTEIIVNINVLYIFDQHALKKNNLQTSSYINYERFKQIDRNWRHWIITRVIRKAKRFFFGFEMIFYVLHFCRKACRHSTSTI